VRASVIWELCATTIPSTGRSKNPQYTIVFYNFPIFHGGAAKRSANISKDNDDFFPSVWLSLLYYIFMILIPLTLPSFGPCGKISLCIRDYGPWFHACSEKLVEEGPWKPCQQGTGQSHAIPMGCSISHKDSNPIIHRFVLSEGLDALTLPNSSRGHVGIHTNLIRWISDPLLSSAEVVWFAAMRWIATDYSPWKFAESKPMDEQRNEVLNGVCDQNTGLTLWSVCTPWMAPFENSSWSQQIHLSSKDAIID
jgi:hypothetical protein